MKGFNYNNPVMQVVIKIVMMIWLNLLWLVGCIPVFTIGASTCGLYYSVQKAVRQERGYAGAEYWKGFKSSFKQATLFWVVVLAAEALLFLDVYLYQQLNELGFGIGAFGIVMLVLMALIGVYSFYVLCYISRFQNRMKAVLVNTMLLSIRHFGRTLLLALVLVLSALIIYLEPLALFFVPVAAVWLTTRILEKVFRKYMTDEQREREDFLNTSQYKDE